MENALVTWMNGARQGFSYAKKAATMNVALLGNIHITGDRGHLL